MSVIQIIEFARILNKLGNLSKDEWKVVASQWNSFSPELQSEIIKVSNYLEKNHARK